MDLKPYRAPLVRVRREGKAPPNRSREPASREAVVFLGEDFGLREEVCGETIEVLSKERLLGLDGLNPIALRTDGPAISYGKWINATDATQKKKPRKTPDPSPWRPEPVWGQSRHRRVAFAYYGSAVPAHPGAP